MKERRARQLPPMSTPPPLEGVVPSLRPSAVIHTDLDSRAELAQLRLQTDWSSGWAAAPKRLARAHAREGLSNEEVRSFDEDAVPSNRLRLFFVLIVMSLSLISCGFCLCLQRHASV